MTRKEIKGFFNNVLSSDDPTSSKRLVTLIISLHFIIASFVILFIAFYVIFYTTKGKVDTALLGMLRDVLEYDFYIILSGLGFITADSLGKMMVERVKAKFHVPDNCNSDDKKKPLKEETNIEPDNPDK